MQNVRWVGIWVSVGLWHSVLAWPALALDALRVDVRWLGDTRGYDVVAARIEDSGTPALEKRAGRESGLGSYRAELVDTETGEAFGYDAVGTGAEFRTLTRAMTFRFPVPARPFEFRMSAENPETGAMEPVARASYTPKNLPRRTGAPEGLSVRRLKRADRSPAVRVNIYAEGYRAGAEDIFVSDAQRAVDTLVGNDYPGIHRMEFYSVYAPSEQGLGQPQNLGYPLRDRQSFLDLYFSYWGSFARWDDVLYPITESRFRDAVGSVPYDYPLILAASTAYFGTGNYNELTVIPAQNPEFAYLLQHELGHYFGLNEEYDSDGTELSFAPGLDEPWSQNMTFHPDRAHLKWGQFVDGRLPLPTPNAYWNGYGPIGAYAGGYGGEDRRSYKPGWACLMSSGQHFCPVCRKAIEDKVKFDVGE